MEFLQPIQLFTDTNKLDRDASHSLNAECCSAASIAVQLGENHAIQFQSVIKRLGTVDRILTGHRIANQQSLVRSNAAVNLLQLFHQRRVDVQTTGGVENHDLRADSLCFLNPVFTDLNRITCLRIFGVNRTAHLAANHLQLLNRRRSL